MDIPFEVRIIPVEENYPEEYQGARISEFIALKKAMAFKEQIQDGELIITADTIVTLDGEVLGKPAGKVHAAEMLNKLSGKMHEVITSVCLFTTSRQEVFSDTTKVFFNTLTPAEIHYYLDRYQPTDKAGAYGIQEWIGYTAASRVEGSYYNVMGLPVEKLYNRLKRFYP